MRTTSSTLPVSPTPALSDETTLAAAVRCLAEHLPLKTQATCQPQTLYQVLLWAASRHDSIEHTAQVLSGVPTGNGLRYHLDKYLDKINYISFSKSSEHFLHIFH